MHFLGSTAAYQKHCRRLFLLGLTTSVFDSAQAHRVFGRDDAAFNWTSLTPSTQLNWSPCYGTFQCARFAVPLRYSDPSGEEAAVAIIKFPSDLSPTDENYRGPILFNPGGPGVSGVDLVLSLARLAREIVGPQFDLYGFDPRGVGRTTPALSVFADPVEAGAFYAQQELDFNATETSLGRAFAQSSILGKLALERAEDISRTVSTPMVVRDMLGIVKAAGQDKLQYWGFSYGTILGATFAAMFPDKVGRLIIDGVADSEAYYAGNRTSDVTDMDKALSNIYESCVQAGLDLCPIYENSADLVRTRVDAILNKLRTDPIPVLNSTAINSPVIDITIARDRIFSTLYSQYTLGASLADALAALEQGDGSLIYQGTRQNTFRTLLEDECPANSNQPFVANLMETTAAIACGDLVSNTSQSIDDLRAAYKEIFAVSPDFGGMWLAGTLCSGWSIRADERFNGSFVQNTSFPLLLIGNTADPATPLASAQKMSKGFVNSVVLTQNSTGHTSTSAASTCTMQAVRAYFVNGTLPEPGTVCQVESTIFNTTDSSASGNGKSSRKRVKELGDDDTDGKTALLKAARGLQSMGIGAHLGRRSF